MKYNGCMSRTIGILVEQDYQDLEVWYPILRFREAGHRVLVIGTGAESYKSKHGYPVQADRSSAKVSAAELDAILVPGGWAPDYLRRHESAVKLVRDVYKAGKPTAAICHAGWMLVSAGILKGKTVTSFFAIRDDVEAAGAKWVDREVQVDGNLITARKPEDLPAFCREVLRMLEKPAPKAAAR